MGQREQLQKRIDSKIEEINNLDSKIRDCKTYVLGLQDAMKLIPKDASNGTRSATLRHGSSLAQAREAIIKAGKPLHISEILERIGKPKDKKNRISLSGSLAAYVRTKGIFTRPAPNTFSLIELDGAGEDGETTGLEFGPEDGEKRQAPAN